MLRRSALCIALLTLVFVSYGQQKWPATFLWKITGNGLSKPSYLYGTIHLQDKRLFRFQDSLYHYIETVDGFALEIDFGELMDSVFTESFRKAEDRMYASSKKYSVDKKKVDKSTDSLLKQFGVQADNISKKDLKKIRDYRVNKMVQKGEMPTIVDGFLYGIAQRLGKTLTGIEDIADQLSIRDEMGADLTPEQVFQPEAILNNSLQQMMDIYIQRDLQKVEDAFNLTNKEFRDQLLTHRNIKMARRMDSLSAIRSTFFAVGVAHLPGDSGVINLLRKKGFTVEPVFSQNYPDATAYLGKLEKLPWKTIDEKYYQVKMPGQPSSFKLVGDLVDMRAFFDLPTMTVYMTGSFVGNIDGDSGFEKMFNNMANNMNSRKKSIKPKYLMVNGVKTGEAEIEIPEGMYRVRLSQINNVVYMQMVGSQKTSNAHSAETERFFESFKGKDIAPEKTESARFTIPGKGASIVLPGKPKPNKSIDRNAEGSSYHFSSYDYVDAQKGVYYLVQTRDLNAGLYLEGDTTYYSATRTEIASMSDKIISDTFYHHQGWPAFKMKFYMKSADSYYTLFNLVRGNRIYNLLVGWSAKSEFNGDEDFLNSFQLDDYDYNTFKRETANGFYTQAPAPFVKIEKDSTEEDDPSREHYVSYDPVTAISFEVFKRAESKYYWNKSDSAYYAGVTLQYKEASDSTIFTNTSWNGSLKGIDVMLQKNGSTTIKKMRGFVNGDTLYYLFAEIPEKYINDERFKGFFNGFRVTKELEPAIFKNKAKEFFEALKNADSLEKSKLMETFNSLVFDKSDLPVLHKALLEEYPKFEEEYMTVNFRISNVMKDLADGSTVRFVADNYKKKDVSDERKYQLLYLLSAIRTKESYELFKELAVNQPPSSERDYRIVWALQDSLELAKQLFPEILKQSKDTNFVEIIVPLVRTLIDSNLLTPQVLAPFQKDLIAEAARRVAVMKNNAESWKLNRDWTKLLGMINNAEGNKLLSDMLHIDDNDLRCEAALSLIKNNQPVSVPVMEKIAADNSYRTYLYNELKKTGKLQLFPAKFATRQKIGESELYGYATEDQEDSVTIKYIGEKTADFLGKKTKFLLYKVTYNNEEESSYLGAVGPYPLAGNEILVDGKGTGIYFEEEFDKNKLDKFLKLFLQSMEKYYKDQETAGKAVK